MAQSKYDIEYIYRKTDGYCHLCHKKLSLKNYGQTGARGAWHVEHSVPKARNGTDHLNNLFPACISCNLEKGTLSSASIRKRNGVSRAPYNKAQKKQIQEENTIKGALIGGALGSLVGPPGIIVGAIVGGLIGESNSPKT